RAPPGARTASAAPPRRRSPGRVPRPGRRSRLRLGLVVEVAQLPLEVADALLLLTVAATLLDVVDEARVVLRTARLGTASGPGAALALALASDREPQDRAEDRRDDHEDDPDELRQVAHPRAVDRRYVDDGEHHDRRQDECQDHA